MKQSMKKYVGRAKEVLKEIPVKIKEHPKTTLALAGAAGLAVLGAKLYTDCQAKTIDINGLIELGSINEFMTSVESTLDSPYCCTDDPPYWYFTGETPEMQKVTTVTDTLYGIEERLSRMDSYTGQYFREECMKLDWSTPSKREDAVAIINEELKYHLKHRLEHKLEYYNSSFHKYFSAVLSETGAGILGWLGYKAYKEESSKRK